MVDFLVTLQVIFSILGEGCLQEFGLLWDHAYGELELLGVCHQLVDLLNRLVSARRITVQRAIVIPARSQVDVLTRLVYRCPSVAAEGAWVTGVEMFDLELC